MREGREFFHQEVVMTEGTTPGVVFGQRLAQVRAKRGISKAALSRRLEELGHPLHRVVLGEIEGGGTRARNVSLEDVLAIAYALGVPPLQMMFPYDEQRVRIVGNREPVEPERLRYWIVGPPYGSSIEKDDTFTYIFELPEKDLADLASSVSGSSFMTAILSRHIGESNERPA
jgi:transcriptional regulator with XRE-family HTH domain